jgi:hypothetical protein
MQHTLTLFTRGPVKLFHALEIGCRDRSTKIGLNYIPFELPILDGHLRFAASNGPRFHDLDPRFEE